MSGVPFRAHLLLPVFFTMATACSAFGAGLSREDPRATVFSTDVAPVLYEHCAVCHRPGGSAPFSLLTYQDVRPHARQIVDAVRRGAMPPWKPKAGFGGPFVGERRLSDREIAILQQWLTDGAREGIDADRPPIPEFRDGWHMGKPDLIVEMAEPYTLPPGGPDVFRNFVLSIPVPTRRFIRGLELLPSNRRVSHHATIRLDSTRASRRLDEQDAEPGYVGVIAPSARYPPGHVLAWTPGQLPNSFPPEFAWSVEPGSDLVVQMHLMPTDRPEPLQLRVGFYFADGAPTRPLATLRLGREDIDIAPGMTRYSVRDSYVLPVDVQVFAVQPHAHYLAKETKAYAVLPDGSLRWLVNIDDWEFEWQDTYRYREPFWLPAGSVLHMEYSYDNSGSRRSDRVSPAKRVRFGEQTSDEMAFLWVHVSPRSSAELAKLLVDYEPKEIAADVVGFQSMLHDSPANADVRYRLAAAFMTQGKIDEALAQAREGTAMQPGSDVAHYNLATMLATSGRREEAVREFSAALRLNPSDPSAHNSLGALYLGIGQADRALEEFREAVTLDPQHARARNNLGAALLHLGRTDEAIDAYQEATRLSPNDPAALYNLGNAFNVSGRMEMAIDAYVRAITLDPEHERACFHLASAFEFQGRYGQAVQYYRRALALRPDDSITLSRLAWVLATAPIDAVRKPSEAVELATRAAASVEESNVLDSLAAAQAAMGQFDLAVVTAERALAIVAGEPSATAIRERLTLYKSHKPYRATFAPK